MDCAVGPDVVVVALYLAAVVAIGGVFARGQRSLKEFFLAGRSIPWWAAALSGMAIRSTLSMWIQRGRIES